MRRIPVTVPAKNEEVALGPCLDALLVAARFAEAREGVTLDLLVALDDCTDGTEAVARGRGVSTLQTSGGKIEALRAGFRGGPIAISVDADVVVTAETLAGLIRTLRERPEAVVAVPPRAPLPPIARTRLARALHVYNRQRGFSSQRTWFSGRCFAMRGFPVPTREELFPRAARQPGDRFYDLEGGLCADDVYLSRAIVACHGPAAIVETTEGCVQFRAPENLRGMYRYYRRMRRELERVSLLFPEFEAVHQAYGRRRADRLGSAPAADRVAWAEFQAWLVLCRATYRLERAYWRRFARTKHQPWPPIKETKCSLGTPAAR